MKLIARIVGSVVIILILAGAALYALNQRGFIKGGLSDFISKMTGHAQNISDDTRNFLKEEGYIHSPDPDPDAPDEPSDEEPETTPALTLGPELN
ncbi:MAG: hypothetical protein FWE69_00565 [Clostridiales bacterium]|nr:hypothetical protein [Clostridiales bacterium]